MPNWRAVLAWSNSDLNYSTLVHSLPERFKTKDRIEKANHIAEMSIFREGYEQTKVSDYRFFFGSSGNIGLYLFLYEKLIITFILQQVNFGTRQLCHIYHKKMHII